MRTKRASGSTVYAYIYDGGNLNQMTVGSNALIFTYGINGQPMSVKYNGVDYYYITNAQGDVVGILNASGTEVVTYTYDAWGNLLSTTGSMASSLGLNNPLRYRGYVYDRETGLYYLQSRYYNPTICRFISADNYPSTGQGLTGNNMFAYCGNNPVTRADEGGECWHLVIGAAVGIVTQYAVDVVTDWIKGESITEILKPNSSIADYASAAISGALAASGIGIAGSIIANAALGDTTYYANCKINGTEADGFDMFLATTIGGLSGAIGGSGVNGARLYGVVKTSKYVLNTAVSTARKNMYKGKIVSAIADVAIGTARTIGAGIFSNLANTGRKHLTGSFY